MRDQHWEQCHQEGQKTNWLQQKTPDEDDLQPLLFDLVRADKVDLFRSLLPQLGMCEPKVKHALLLLAAGSGSPAMIDLIALTFKPGKIYDLAVYTASIKGNNIDTFRHLLSISGNQIFTRFGFGSGENSLSRIFLEVLKAGSEEFRLDLERYVDAEYEWWKNQNFKDKTPFVSRYTGQVSLRAVTSDNEAYIPSLWKKSNLAYEKKQYLGDALVNVATTCCSLKLAKYLTDAGAAVNHRRSAAYLTPLHHAVMHDTAEATELVKFLLSLGADPEAFSTNASRLNKGKIRRIRDEVGAKNISKWLGVSWDDLVATTAAESAGTEAGNTKEGNT